MIRSILVTSLVLLAGANVYSLWRIEQLSDKLRLSERGAVTLSSDSERLSQQIKAAEERVEALKASMIVAKPAPRDDGISPLIGQLGVAQSHRLDRIVEWVSLIEDKIYFILFPPVEQSEKDRRAFELRTRTDEIRTQFQAVAETERLLRERVTEQLDASAPPLEEG